MSRDHAGSARATNLLLVLAVCASALAGFYRLGEGEFFGEDEAQVMIKVARQFLWREDYRNLGAILTSSHPPMRLLLPTPFVGLFGPTEFWLRFPNAVAGILVCLWVYRLGRRAFSEEVGALGALFTAVSGMNGVYRSANGIGVFTLFVLVSLEFLLIFVDAKEQREERRALVGVAFFLGLATLTFLEGAVFWLPVAATYLHKRRHVHRDVWLAASVYSLMVGAYAIGWGLVPWLASVTGVYAAGSSNFDHLWTRLGSLGALNLGDLVNRMVGTNSIWLIALVVSGLPCGIATWGTKGRAMASYFVPHLLVWLFVFENPSGHGVYATPVLVVLSAHGIHRLLADMLRTWVARAAVAVGVGLVLLLAGWHTYVVFLQERASATIENGVLFREPGIPDGVSRFRRVGQAAAGVYIRERAEPDTMILTDFGGSLELYYAGRPSSHPPLAELLGILEQPGRMRNLGIRYLVLRNGEISRLRPDLRWEPTVVITVDREPRLWIYDLWHESGPTDVWPSERYRPDFYGKYANWIGLRPFLSEDA